MILGQNLEIPVIVQQSQVQGEPSNDYHKRKLCSMQNYESTPRQMLIN